MIFEMLEFLIERLRFIRLSQATKLLPLRTAPEHIHMHAHMHTYVHAHAFIHTHAEPQIQTKEDIMCMNRYLPMREGEEEWCVAQVGNFIGARAVACAWARRRFEFRTNIVYLLSFASKVYISGRPQTISSCGGAAVYGSLVL